MMYRGLLSFSVTLKHANIWFLFPMILVHQKYEAFDAQQKRNKILYLMDMI